MAKESISKENPVADALKRLKEDEADLLAKLKPVQEAVSALEKIMDKSTKKSKASAKDNASENASVENTTAEEEFQEAVSES